MKKILYVSFAILLVGIVFGCNNQRQNYDNSITADSIDNSESIVSADMLYDGKIVHSSFADQRLLKIMLSIINKDKSALASEVDYPLYRIYPLKDIEDSVQMVEYFDVIFDDSIRNIIRNMTVESWDFHNYKGITFSHGEYIWTTEEGCISGINYYSERESALLEGLRKQEMSSLDKSLQGDWYPLLCLRDIDDGTVFRVDGHYSEYADNYGEEIRMAIYDEGKNLYGKPSRVLMGVYYLEGSWPSTYLYCSSHLDMVWLSFSFDDFVEPSGLKLNYYERGWKTERIVKHCYWLDLLK